jgi:serine/threonine protein kinase
MTAPAARVGRYELVRRLAAGGMAELHLARMAGPPGFEKQVVVKQILPIFSATPAYVDMFLDEARLAGKLNHPNLVQVIDVGRDGDRWFIVMEYLHGHDLRDILAALQRRDRRMPIVHAVDITIGICAGLHHAHELRDEEGRSREIVHRDVSPRNVVVTFDGGVKVVDFGIAKSTERRTETTQGELKGKLRYMSPEQCRRGAIDRRADVFAVAAVLWELTVGQRLFDGLTDEEVMQALRDGRFRKPSELVPDYPPELEQIVMRGLALALPERWPTAEALGQALVAFSTAQGLEPMAFQLGNFVRSLFADGGRDTPLPVRLPEAHAIPTALSASQIMPRRARWWLVAGGVLALLGLISWRPRRPPVPKRLPVVESPSPIVRPQPQVLEKPKADPVVEPEPARPPRLHRHQAPKHGARKPLSDNLDALME